MHEHLSQCNVEIWDIAEKQNHSHRKNLVCHKQHHIFHQTCDNYELTAQPMIVASLEF